LEDEMKTDRCPLCGLPTIRSETGWLTHATSQWCEWRGKTWSRDQWAWMMLVQTVREKGKTNVE
jgi:hypothetical protein